MDPGSRLLSRHISMEGRRAQEPRDKWHHPPAACSGADCIITRSPFISTDTGAAFSFQDGERPGAAMEEARGRSHTVTTTCSSSYCQSLPGTAATLTYDRGFLSSPPGLLLLAEIVLGLLVWALIAGSDYFFFPTFGWVMFVAVFFWVLTVFLLIIYVTRAYNRITKVPWPLVDLCFNGSAFVLYLIAAVVAASSVTKEHHHDHNYNSWVASAFFAFLVTACYAASTYYSFRCWRTRS